MSFYISVIATVPTVIAWTLFVVSKPRIEKSKLFTKLKQMDTLLTIDSNLLLNKQLSAINEENKKQTHQKNKGGGGGAGGGGDGGDGGEGDGDGNVENSIRQADIEEMLKNADFKKSLKGENVNEDELEEEKSLSVGEMLTELQRNSRHSIELPSFKPTSFVFLLFFYFCFLFFVFFCFFCFFLCFL